jgi:hypothetical protein
MQPMTEWQVAWSCGVASAISPCSQISFSTPTIGERKYFSEYVICEKKQRFCILGKGAQQVELWVFADGLKTDG